MFSLPRINPQQVAPGIILKRDIPAEGVDVVATGQNPDGPDAATTSDAQTP
jgi:hypothetical protein